MLSALGGIGSPWVELGRHRGEGVGIGNCQDCRYCQRSPKLKEKDLGCNRWKKRAEKEAQKALKMHQFSVVIQATGRGTQRNQQSYLPGDRQAGYLELWSLITSRGSTCILTGW